MDSLLRWPGGKQWLARRLSEVLRPAIRSRWIEPFLGSGAMFFAIRPALAILNDTNKDLIECYKVVRNRHAAVRRTLESMPCSPECYYSIRSMRPTCSIARAARFLYLNRTCYGGIYRTNRRGEFNVPYGGRTTAGLLGGPAISNASMSLRQASLVCGDFSVVLADAGPGDIAFCDPVYVSSANPKTFDRYGWSPHDWSLQERLRSACDLALSQGASVLVTNVAAPDVLKLYSGIPKVKFSINSSLSVSKQRVREEVMFVFSQDRQLHRSLQLALRLK